MPNRFRHAPTGYTLVEVLIVVMILGIAAAVVMVWIAYPGLRGLGMWLATTAPTSADPEFVARLFPAGGMPPLLLAIWRLWGRVRVLLADHAV